MHSESFEMSMDFYADVIEMMCQELQQANYKVSPNEPAEAICRRYFSVQQRSIPIKPRTVLKSKEFSCPDEHKLGLQIIEEKARQGEDLTPHLSTSIRKADYNDLMLNAWGIHHLHLGTKPHAKEPGLVSRTGPLLFARVTNDSFYIINVLEHGSWTNTDVIEILHRNWPDSIKSYILQGFEAGNYSQEALDELRRGHVNTLVAVSDGTVYAPIGGGTSTSGLSFTIRYQCDYLRALMVDLESTVRANVSYWIPVARAQGEKIGSPLNFKLIELLPEHFRILETNSSVTFMCPIPGVD